MKRGGPLPRRTPLNRGKSLAPGAAMARTGIVTKRLIRDWTEARAKVDRERTCRVDDRDGSCAGRLQAVHVIGIAAASLLTGTVVEARDIIPLCGAHHRAYDAHGLNLLPYLTPEEQTRAVQVAGGIASATRRISGR